MSASSTSSGGGPRRSTRSLLGLGILALLAAGVYLGVQLERRASTRDAFPQVDGRISVEGLLAPQTLVRDDRGVPHVLAASERDAYWGMGFAHAQDRLGQMLWLRAQAHGRAAEYAGASHVEADRWARLVGFRRLARRVLPRLYPGTRTLLDAYVAGVNARMDRVRRGEEGAPLRVRTQGLPLDPWTAADSLAVLKLYAFALGASADAGSVLEAMIVGVGPYAAAPFFPAGRAPKLPEPARRAALRPAAVAALASAVGLSGASAGSSALVVSGASSRSGRPLLAADLHVAPTAPSLFHQVHVRGGDIDAAGATIPGIPLVWAGQNGRVAWAGAFAGAVVSDLFEEVLSRDGLRYHDGTRWQDLLLRDEVIAVRTGEDQSLQVAETRHGPLVGRWLPAPRPRLALHWTGAMPRDPLAGLLGAARARSASGLRASLEEHHEPVLTFVFADVDGGGGRQVAGSIPDRKRPTGMTSVPGRSGDYDWRGRLPVERLPGHRLSSKRPWLVASDGPLWQGTGIEGLWRSGERGDRIAALLRRAGAQGPLDLAELTAIQHDLRSGNARRLVALLLELAGDEASLGREARETARYLREWDGRATADSVGASMYHVLLPQLLHRLYDAALGEELLDLYLALPHVQLSSVVARVVAGPPSDDGEVHPGPERVAAAVRAGLRDAWLRMSVERGANRAEWSWGALHALRFTAATPVREPTQRRWLGPHAYPGDASSPLAGDHAPSGPFDVRLASTFRFLVDLGEPATPLSSLAPGQSEHPSHPHFADEVERWLLGRPSPLVTTSLWIEESAVSRLELEPAP